MALVDRGIFLGGVGSGYADGCAAAAAGVTKLHRSGKS